MILDIIALAIILFSVIMGVKKGLIKTLFGTLSVILAIFLTVGTMDVAFSYVKETDFGKSIYEKTAISLTQNVEIEENNFLMQLIDVNTILETAEDVEKSISLALGDVLLKALCAVLLFLLFFILMKLLSKILDAIAKLPVLRTVNKLGGALSGLLTAYIVLILYGCALIILSSSALGVSIAEQLETSKIASWFYLNNPIL